MIYLDNGATSFHKPLGVADAVRRAMFSSANPGRGGYSASMTASKTVYKCREVAARLFSCQPEQVVFTSNCTHGLNMAIQSLVKAGEPVVISGFEHNSVSRPLYALGADVRVAGRKLFDWEDTLEQFEEQLKQGAKTAVFTHVSNVFGYVLPVEQMAELCKRYGVPFILDAAQSAGALPVSLKDLDAAFVAMPGHKGLLGPQGTGILLCGHTPRPLLYGGTGSSSAQQQMPGFLPDVGEAGTLNVPGIAGLCAGMEYLLKRGIHSIAQKEHREAMRCARGLEALGVRVFRGQHQLGTVSFTSDMDCEELAQQLADRGIAVRAGLHCAPLAHESAGTLDTGTVRVSFGHDTAPWQTRKLLEQLEFIIAGSKH